MRYKIELGIPEIRDLYIDLLAKAKANKLDKNQIKLFKKLTKTLSFLEDNPFHNSLNSHEIKNLSERYSKITGYPIKVWQSYLENKAPSAGRLFWVYGPSDGVITIIGLEPHPEDQKKGGYFKIKLSNLPEPQ